MAWGHVAAKGKGIVVWDIIVPIAVPRGQDTEDFVGTNSI
jgi:hypothetical protein